MIQDMTSAVEPEQACPIAPVIDIVFSRWTTPILWVLNEYGRHRFVELERRITEVQAQDERLTTWLTKVDELAAALRAIAAEPPSVSEGADHAPRLSLVRAKPAPASAPAEGS